MNGYSVHRSRWMARVQACLLAGMLITVSGASGAAVPAPSGRVDAWRQADEMVILAVLEERTGDERLVRKAEDRLAVMDPREVRLMAALCLRISGRGRTAGTEIVFSLVTALMVLS